MKEFFDIPRGLKVWCAIVLSLSAIVMFSQDKPKAIPEAPKEVVLTAAEKSQREAERQLHQQKIDNVNLRIQLLMTQNKIYDDEAALNAEGAALDDKYYQSHGLDKKEYFLQPNGTFVKIPPPPAAAKPEPKK